MTKTAPGIPLHRIMLLEACMDRSGDDMRHEHLKDLLMQGAKEIERLTAQIAKQPDITARGATAEAQLSLFGVEIRSGVHDTQYLFRTETADEAVEVYLKKAIDGDISVDMADIDSSGELRVIRFPDEGPAGFTSWEDVC